MECRKNSSKPADAHSEIICGLLILADYKQKYGEEHGSCQAGIAGVFTEVSLCLFITLIHRTFVLFVETSVGNMFGQFVCRK